MKENEKLKPVDYFKKMSLSFKIQFIAACACSLFLLTLPVYAWFNNINKIEAMSKVKEPPSINLASGHEDSAIYVTLENIDVSKGDEQYVIFSVEPGKYPAYDIQLTHTTNIPFDYELSRVKESENGTIEYIGHSEDANGNITTSIYKYTETETLTLSPINPDSGSTGRVLGDEEDLAAFNRRNYDTTLDIVDQYVKPIYSVCRHIPKQNDDGNEKRDYFALKLHWIKKANVTDVEYWNYAFNNKETDIIYISAKQNTPPASDPQNP